MHNQHPVELAKTRDLSEIINDTFTFVKQNFKPLIKIIFTFCGLFMLAAAGVGALYQVKLIDMQRRLYDGSGYQNFNTSRFTTEYFLTIGFAILAVTMMTLTVLSYMALYKQKDKQPPTAEEVWGYIKYYFIRVIIATIFLGLLLIVATAICFFPGVYVYPIFGLVFPIMIIENASFSYGFNRAFILIKNNWWMTFGTLFVMGLITYVSYMIFSLPSLVLYIYNMLTHGAKSSFTSTPVVIVISLLNHLGQILYALPIIALGLCYYNLNEIKEGTGLLDRINQFGTQNPNDNLPAEEY